MSSVGNASGCSVIVNMGKVNRMCPGAELESFCCNSSISVEEGLDGLDCLRN